MVRQIVKGILKLCFLSIFCYFSLIGIMFYTGYHVMGSVPYNGEQVDITKYVPATHYLVLRPRIMFMLEKSWFDILVPVIFPK